MRFISMGGQKVSAVNIDAVISFEAARMSPTDTSEDPAVTIAFYFGMVNPNGSNFTTTWTGYRLSEVNIALSYIEKRIVIDPGSKQLVLIDLHGMPPRTQLSGKRNKRPQ